MPVKKADQIDASGSRVRVTFFLPAQQDKDAKAARQVIAYLKKQRNAGLPISGLTTSSARPTMFSGAWYNKDSGLLPVGWCDEGVIQIILDLSTDMNDESVTRAMSRWRVQFAKIYKECGSEQAEFWLIAHPVVQFLAA